jgi:WD40 repeat protein
VSSVSAPTSPFKGLAAFEDSELDALLFFGRERESEVIASNLMASRLTVLFGPTGVGKSSVLRAGVVHRLRRETGVEIVVHSSWTGDPVSAIEETAGVGGSSLADALGDAAARAGGDLYLVLDQFEEYFLYHERDRRFVEELAEVVRRPGLRVNVLIGIREDTLAQLDVFKALIPNLLANRLRLDPLDRAAGRAAIVGPIRRYNELVGAERPVEIEPELVTAVLDEVAAGRVELGVSGRGVVLGGADGDRIEAPYLQLVMARLWKVEEERDSQTLRLDTLRELGGAAKIVEDHLEHAMTELSPREKDAAAAMYNFLVTPSGTKIAHGVRDLAGYADVEENEAANVLRRLAAERIVRASSENGAATRYEIYHDVLADAVLAWRNRHAAERALHEAERRRRRALGLAGGALAGLLLVAAIAIFALVERSHSRADARRAHARELAAGANAQLRIDPQRAVQLALEAAKLEPGQEEERVLREALIAARLRRTLPAGGPVEIAAFDPTGGRVLSGSQDGSIRIYPTGARRPEQVLQQGGAVTAAAFDPTGEQVLTGGLNGVGHLWRAEDGADLQQLDAGGPVRGAMYARGGDVVLTLAANGWIRLWRARDGRMLRSLRVHGKAIPAGGAVDQTGRRLVTVGRDRFARVYSLATGRLIRSLPHRGFIRSTAFSPTGRLILTSGYEGRARLWNARTGRLVQELRGPDHSALGQAVFSPDGRLVAAASNDGTARVWEAATGFQLAIMIGHQNRVSKVAFNPAGDAVVTASVDGTAKVWRTDGSLINVLAGHRQPVKSVSFSPDGSLVLTGSEDGTARLWDPGSEADLLIVGRQQSPSAFAASVDGRFLVGGSDGIVTVRHVSQGVVQTRSVKKPVTAVAFGPAGALAVQLPARSVAYSSEAGLIAEGHADGSVRLATASGAQRFKLRSMGGGVGAVSFSPDGRLLAAGSDDGTVRVWDLRTRRVLHTLKRHTLAVTSTAFSPGGSLLVTASLDKDVGLWSVDRGKLVHLVRWHFGPVSGASFSPDGRWIVTAGPGTAGVGLAATGERVLFLRGHSRPLIGAGFASVDGSLIVTASKDGTIRRYRCDLCGDVHQLIALAERRLAR